MSRNSRRPSKTTSVDESLFGTSSARRATTPPSARVNTSTLNKLLADPATETDSIVISKQEIEKMKLAARLADDKEFEHAKHAQTLAKEEQMSKAKARKEKMIALEQAQRNQAPELTEFEQEAIRRKSEILGNAKASLDEQHDDVKHMNQMMLYAQCVTIRDQQLAEKAILLKEKQEEQRRLDQEMDEFRRKKLREVEERELVRTHEQKKGAAVIVAQMKEREIERLRARELKEQEAQQILEQIKEREQKEAEERLIKAEEGRKLLQIIMAANNEQAQAKNAKKREALEEDQRIAEYLKQKHQKEAEKEAELAAKKAEKEREIARLRAMQEKAYDRQAELDAIRARRYQESLERKQRQKDLDEARKREQSIEDIKKSHEQQQREAHQRKAEQLLQEKAEYERILASQKEFAERTSIHAKEEQMERTMHRQELLTQITDHEKAKTEKRRHFVEEGRKLTEQFATEQARLEAIKAAKLAQLEKLGVPEKYRAELAKKKVLQSKLT